MHAALIWASSIAGSLAALGCADPCFDDGLAQGGCPEQATDQSATDPSADATRGDADASADGTVDDGVPTGGGSGIECPQLEEVLLPQVPTFQLVVDQSGSMDQDFDAGVSRWEAVEGTLVGPDGVVTQLQSSIRFGISFYANPMVGTCPAVLSLAPQLDAADEISAAFATEQPGGDTPTGESLEQITSDLLDDQWDGDKVIVLATDGEPDTCEIPDPAQGAETDMVRGVAVDAVAAAYAKGIRTFVVSVGLDIAEGHLQDLANAGVGNGPGDPDAPFYVANDNASLVAAFDAIVAGLRPCTFTLNGPLPPAQATSCTLTVNNDEIPHETSDGWIIQANETTLELQGAACDAIQQGVVAIELKCACQ